MIHHALTVGMARNADLLVIELFAFLHDSQRHDERRDRGHGGRAAEYARALNETFLNVKPNQINLLCMAISEHSGGKIETSVTIQSFLDADRLDLGRVGIVPPAEYLSKEAVLYIEDAGDWSRQ